MRVTVFWNKGRRDGRQAARRFFALSESGGSTKKYITDWFVEGCG
jgi:hypothetical protein